MEHPDGSWRLLGRRRSHGVSWMPLGKLKMFTFSSVICKENSWKPILSFGRNSVRCGILAFKTPDPIMFFFFCGSSIFEASGIWNRAQNLSATRVVQVWVILLDIIGYYGYSWVLVKESILWFLIPSPAHTKHFLNESPWSFGPGISTFHWDHRKGVFSTRWCPPSYKLVYNPNNYRYNPHSSTLVMGLMFTNWTLTTWGTTLYERGMGLFHILRHISPLRHLRSKQTWPRPKQLWEACYKMRQFRCVFPSVESHKKALDFWPLEVAFIFFGAARSTTGPGIPRDETKRMWWKFESQKICLMHHSWRQEGVQVWITILICRS